MKGWPSARVLSASRKPLSGRALRFLQRPLWPRSDSPRGVEEAQLLLGLLLLDRCPHIWWYLLGTGPCLVAMPAVGLTGAPAPPVHLALSFRGAACDSCRPRVQAGLSYPGTWTWSSERMENSSSLNRFSFSSKIGPRRGVSSQSKVALREPLAAGLAKRLPVGGHGPWAQGQGQGVGSSYGRGYPESRLENHGATSGLTNPQMWPPSFLDRQAAHYSLRGKPLLSPKSSSPLAHWGCFWGGCHHVLRGVAEPAQPEGPPLCLVVSTVHTSQVSRWGQGSWSGLNSL